MGRPLAALTVFTALTVLLAVPSGEPLRGSPTRVTPETRRTEVSEPVVTPSAPADVAAMSQPMTAASADLTPLPRRPKPTAVLGPDRLGVYTPSGEFGRFDIFLAEKGRPTFQHRNTYLVMFWSHIVTLDDGWLFFYRESDGAQGTSPIQPDGKLAYGDDTVRGSPGWTSVTGVGGEIVWFYRADTGKAWAIRYVDGFHAGNIRYDRRVGAGFDEAVGIGSRHVLHYRADTGKARLATLSQEGRIESLRDLTLPSGWTVRAGTLSGRLVGVNPAGRATIMRVVGDDLHYEDVVDLGGVGWSQATGLRDGVVVTGLTGQSRLVRFVDGRAHTVPWRVPVGALVAAVR